MFRVVFAVLFFALGAWLGTWLGDLRPVLVGDVRAERAMAEATEPHGARAEARAGAAPYLEPTMELMDLGTGLPTSLEAYLPERDERLIVVFVAAGCDVLSEHQWRTLGLVIDRNVRFSGPLVIRVESGDSARDEPGTGPLQGLTVHSANLPADFVGQLSGSPAVYALDGRGQTELISLGSTAAGELASYVWARGTEQEVRK